MYKRQVLHLLIVPVRSSDTDNISERHTHSQRETENDEKGGSKSVFLFVCVIRCTDYFILALHKNIQLLFILSSISYITIYN